MTKVISLTCLHYGTDYLQYALHSVADVVDECWCLYTPQGSFGAQAPVPCPESEAELLAIAQAGAGNKLRWHRGFYNSEGEHRDMIYNLCSDIDYMMIVDSDEVWEEGLAEDVIHHFEAHPDQRSVRIHTPQLWRSFWRGMPNDGLYAEHGWCPKNTGSWGYLESNKKLFHFGYAQRPEIVKYKQLVHGHRNEWKPNWFDETFLPNAQRDVHPTINNFWNPEDIDLFAMGLPDWMHSHPYCNLAVIE